jgi:uroporphyrinogen decarboxylase
MLDSRWWKGPVAAEPDFDNLLKVLGREVPGRPTLFEFFFNGPLERELAGPDRVAEAEAQPHTNEIIRIWAFRNAGYDYATVHGSTFGFPAGDVETKSTRSLNQGTVISDRETFEKYDWPDADACDYSVLDDLRSVIPDGMKLITMGPCGVLENATSLVGYETLCWITADDPGLAQDIFDAVGSRLVRYYENCLKHDTVGAIIGNDDWGFKTQPMFSPAQMRQFVFPWHKRIVEAAHMAGRPTILHSCGNLVSVMDDIINDMKYDAKHSYEDTIMPVEDAYEEYSDRIAVVGGLDVDFVVRSSPEQVYERARAMLERSAGRGAYGLGTRNSVPEYVPDENFLAMISAATESRR